MTCKNSKYRCTIFYAYFNSGSKETMTNILNITNNNFYKIIKITKMETVPKDKKTNTSIPYQIRANNIPKH